MSDALVVWATLASPTASSATLWLSFRSLSIRSLMAVVSSCTDPHLVVATSTDARTLDGNH